MYASFEISTSIYPNAPFGSIGNQIVYSNPLPTVYGSYFYFAYLFTFISVYSITLLSLRTHLKKIKPAIFYLLFSIPLIYFMLKLLPFFTEYIASLIAYSPTYYGTIYSLTFSGTGPLGGVLFSIVLLIFSRKMDNEVVRHYLSISALGMLLFFIANQNPPLQESLLPPFGLISKSFIGLSCYMILIGIYYTVIHLSRRNSLTNAVLKELSKDKIARPSPEERYKQEKANFLFHDLSCYMRGLSDEEYGCDGAGCVPECRFYPATGRIEDEEVIEKHKELVERHKQENSIVEPPSESELLNLAEKY